MTGAINRSSGSNEGFQEICDTPALAALGIVKDCVGGTCYTAFNSFLKSDSDPLDPLIRALDSNADGKVNAADRTCDVNLIGFSWGGIGVAKLARIFLDDSRVDPSRKSIAKLIAMDPYRPAASLDIPKEVKQAWVFRRSVVPNSDCSKTVGPYVGKKPTCEAPAQCIDMDYSLAPTGVFTFLSGGSIRGADVGHCTVPYAAGPSVVALLQGKPAANLPPRVP
jgi:pimeloyl-ACP methyl ester carboxylesterase